MKKFLMMTLALLATASVNARVWVYNDYREDATTHQNKEFDLTPATTNPSDVNSYSWTDAKGDYCQIYSAYLGAGYTPKNGLEIRIYGNNDVDEGHFYMPVTSLDADSLVHVNIWYRLAKNHWTGNVGYENFKDAPFMWTSGNNDWHDNSNLELSVYLKVVTSPTGEVTYYVRYGQGALVTGVDDVKVSEQGTPVYYNLQGVKVANPESGIYIKVLNGKSTKVLIK
jgi:hypothetical protein